METIKKYQIGEVVKVDFSGTFEMSDFRTGTIIEIQQSGDGAIVDFGSSNTYGILWHRMIQSNVEIMETMESIQFVLTSAKNKMRFLQDSRKNANGHFPNLVKTYSHRIMIMEMSIVRLQLRITNQALKLIK